MRIFLLDVWFLGQIEYSTIEHPWIINEILLSFSVATKLVFRLTCNREHDNQTLENTLAAFALTISWSVFATEFARVCSAINIYVEMFYKILNTMVITTVSNFEL